MKLLWLNVAIVTCAWFHAEALSCKPGQLRFRSSCYQLLTGTMTWDEGDAACFDMDAALAVPDSLVENQFIWKMFTTSSPEADLWIGCNDRDERYKWMKSRNRGECKFIQWADGEPSNGGHSCMQMWKDSLLDDAYCTLQRLVICESSDPPAVPTMSCLQRYADARSSSHCLTGHVIKEFSAKGVIACGSACWGEPACRSFNLRRGGPGEMICQLNDIARSEADVKNIRLDNSCKYFNF